MIHLQWMVSEIVTIFFFFSKFHRMILSYLVAAPPSVIGIGDDHANLTTDKDHYDHVMSPFHRTFIPLSLTEKNLLLFL